jgi:hypothetical protein
MSRRRHANALALVLLLAAGAAAQEPTPTPPAGTFEKAEAAARPEAPESAGGLPAFEFERSGYRYHIANNGAGRRTKGEAVRLFNLRLVGTDWIEHVYFAEYEGNVLLACEVSDGVTGAGFVVRLEQPSMRARWRAELPAFNLGLPVRDGPHLYLTAAGFVAKLDLRTGLYDWRHSRLAGRAGPGTFNAFGPAEVAGDEVVFREQAAGDRPAKAVRVNRRTGKILGIE